MKKLIVPFTLLIAASSGAAMAASPNVQGGSSGSGVDEGPSNHLIFGGGNSGLALGGAWTRIDIAGGPVMGSNAAIAAGADANGDYFLTPAILGLPGTSKIAQVWRSEASVNGSGNEYANFAINSVRQIDPPLFAPRFGGLVVGQVGENTTHANGPADPVVPLAVETGVYFGEWAPAVENPDHDGNYDLNMADADRTVWYVGDDAVVTMPTAIDATYGVIGISETGTDEFGVTLAGGLPDNLNLYKGKLDVTYDSSQGSGVFGPVSGVNDSISREVNGNTHTISFAGTVINSDGTFGNLAATNTIEGRFYNGAEALAGMYTNGTYADAAFGGSKIDGTITP